jgi:hypothetical protein
MSRHYLDGSKRRNMGAGAWLRWKRQWFRRQSGIIAAGAAFAYGDCHKQLIHKGGKP